MDDHGLDWFAAAAVPPGVDEPQLRPLGQTSKYSARIFSQARPAAVVIDPAAAILPLDSGVLLKQRPSAGWVGAGAL